MTPTFTRIRSPMRRLTLNTDGQAHPRENTLALLTFLSALVSVVTAFNEAWHVPGTWAGATGLVLGAFGQMISVTLAQRWVFVISLVLAFVGTMLNIAHGGFV